MSAMSEQLPLHYSKFHINSMSVCDPFARYKAKSEMPNYDLETLEMYVPYYLATTIFLGFQLSYQFVSR
jgi:hypothetical protein